MNLNVKDWGEACGLAASYCKELRERLEPRLGKWEHGTTNEPCLICKPVAVQIYDALREGWRRGWSAAEDLKS